MTAIIPTPSEIDMQCIDRLPSGNYRLRMRVAKRPVKKIFTTIDEALRVRDAIWRELADNTLVPIDGTSITILGPMFLRKREGNRDASTERSRWNRHIATASFTLRPLVTISKRDLLDWLDDLKGTISAQRGHSTKPLKVQTRRHCLNLLRRFFAWAVEREYMTTNPALGLKVEREDGDEDDGYQDGWYLTNEEQVRLLDVADDRDRLIIAFAIGTGLRLNELNCLHLADVHVAGDQPHVVVRFGSWDRKKKQYLSPKGKKGEKRTRTVPLFGPALDAARAWMKLLPSYAKRNPLGLMFPTPRGARREQPPRSWKATAERFGVVPRLGRKVWWHLLRHTCASSLVAGWWGRRWTLDEVRTVLGHSTVRVTERYAHLAESVVQEVGTLAHAAWLGRRSHSVVTNPKIPRRKGRSGRSSKPDVVSSNLTGRALILDGW